MPKTFRIIAISLVGLAILLGIIALGVGKKTASEATPVATAQASELRIPQVVVANKDLPAGVPVSLGDLQTIDAPGGQTAGYYTSPLQAQGAIPTRIIPTGTQLRPDHFLRGLSSHLYTGERALAIGVDDITSVGSHVVPGDYVDVYLNLGASRGASGTEQQPAMSRLLASRLRVLAIGSDSVATADASLPQTVPNDGGVVADGSVDSLDRAAAINARASNTDTGGNRPRSRSGTAVLAVSPDDAATQLVAAQEGSLTLSLRNPADPTIANREMFRTQDNPRLAALGELSADDRAYAGISSRQLVAQAAALQPAPAVRTSAPARRSRPAVASAGVQIIRGSEAPRPLSTH